MKLSAKSRYGTRLMLDMAQHYSKGPFTWLRSPRGRESR